MVQIGLTRKPDILPMKYDINDPSFAGWSPGGIGFVAEESCRLLGDYYGEIEAKFISSTDGQDQYPQKHDMKSVPLLGRRRSNMLTSMG